MKLKILKFSLVALMFAATAVGCQDENDLFELQIGDENAVIQKEVDGIEFKFCLLNEQGEPATVFNEGENFTFQLSIKNKKEKSLPFYNYGFIRLKDFFAVQFQDNYMGKPYLYDENFDSDLHTDELRWLMPDSIAYYTDTWINNDADRNEIQQDSLTQLNVPLKQGRYHTQFSYNFTFGYRDKMPVYESGELKFKINFEIK